MKKWFNVFVYISLGFLISALIRADYLKIPDIYSGTYIILSLSLVYAGFLFDTLAWHKTLIHFGYHEIKATDSLISMGLSIFGKYMPGKVWTIIGRSAYIAKGYNLPEKDIAIVSLNAQFISFWIGLLLGIIGLVFIGTRYYLLELSILVWLLFTVLLFSRVFHNVVIKLIYKIFKKEIIISSLSIKSILRLLPWFVINWFLWCLGFYFLIVGLSQDATSAFLGLSFALAGTLSLLVLIIPGALGIRESLLATVLIIGGLEETLAISISVASRLWFLFGEFFIFLLAILLKWFTSRALR